jgi:ribosome-associated protein
MDLRSLSSVTDFFVIGTGGSVRQLIAITDHIEEQLRQKGSAVWHVEGTRPTTPRPVGGDPQPHWILMDCGDVVVHLLDARARTLYGLEHLWADAPRVRAVPVRAVPGTM